MAELCYTADMRKRFLGKTGLMVSELGLGTWGLSGDGYAPPTDADPDAVIDRALALGITLFDTADSYANGAMEKRLGERLKDHPDAVLVTKLGTLRERSPAHKSFAPAFIKESFERSRDRIQRSALDVVLLHNPSERSLERGEATNVLRELKESGAIRAWGVSVEGVGAVRAALKQGAEVVELAFNVFHNRMVRELGHEMQDLGVGVLARSVLAHGLLCGQWSLDKEFASTDHRSQRWTSDELKRRIMNLNALRPCVDNGTVATLRAAALRFVLASDVVTTAVLGPRSALQLDQLVREAGREPPYLHPQAVEALYLRLDAMRVWG